MNKTPKKRKPAFKVHLENYRKFLYLFSLFRKSNSHFQVSTEVPFPHAPYLCHSSQLLLVPQPNPPDLVLKPWKSSASSFLGSETQARYIKTRHVSDHAYVHTSHCSISQQVPKVRQTPNGAATDSQFLWRGC